MRERLLGLLRAQPFRDFRIELRNGNAHVIRHEGQVMLSGDMAYIGVPRANALNTHPCYADVAMIGSQQIIKLEVLQQASAAGQ